MEPKKRRGNDIRSGKKSTIRGEGKKEKERRERARGGNGGRGEESRARSVREKGENGRVNREIARHTQNSTARWNLNSVSGGVEFASVRLPPSPFVFPRRFPRRRSFLLPRSSPPPLLHLLSPRASSHGVSPLASPFSNGELARLILFLS